MSRLNCIQYVVSKIGFQWSIKDARGEVAPELKAWCWDGACPRNKTKLHRRGQQQQHHYHHQQINTSARKHNMLRP